MRPQVVLFGDSITEQSFRPGGWGSALADTYSRKADVMVRGYGGYNTRWALFLLNHIFPLSCTEPPFAVTIFFGANDAALLGRNSQRQHVPMEEYKENLRKIVHHLKGRSKRTWTWAVREIQGPILLTEDMVFDMVELVERERSPTMLVVLITPPPVDEDGRMEYARSLYGEKAMKEPERTNEMAGVYAKQCVDLARELSISSIDLWSKMQETAGWQKKYLSDGLHLTEEGNAVVHKEVVRVINENSLIASEMPYDFPHHSEINSEKPEEAFRWIKSEI